MKIGLMLHLSDDDALGRPPSFETLRDMSIAADDAGLDSVWGADHLIFRREDGADETSNGIHECWTVLSAVAAVTRRVEIGPLVLAMPFRPPALLAKMATTLDEVSGGRLILGIGSGWHEPEFDAFGYPFDHRVGRFEEALAVLLPLLRGERVTHEGRWYAVEDAQILPPGPRAGGPPILIAGKQPRMLRLVAEHADLWNAAWYGLPETAGELDERVHAVRAALDAAGRDPATLGLTAGVFVAFPELYEGPNEEPPKRAMTGTVQEVGRQLASYADRGMSHLICHLWPSTPRAVEQLAAAAEVARSVVRDGLRGAETVTSSGAGAGAGSGAGA
jgi:probable F420-dependent oxidoreductase